MQSNNKKGNTIGKKEFSPKKKATGKFPRDLFQSKNHIMSLLYHTPTMKKGYLNTERFEILQTAIFRNI